MGTAASLPILQNWTHSVEDIEREIQRRQQVDDPVLWCYHQLGIFAWSKQREILRSVRDNRRTSVRSCHASGKSLNAAAATLWWIASHPPNSAFVLTTAPTNQQVRTILWREIGILFNKSGIDGEANQTELKIRADNRLHIVAIGRKPGDLNENAFQGIHGQYVLIIIDEAAGVPKNIWDAAESIISGGHGRILAIGNPVTAGTEFHKTFRPNSGYNNIHISAFDTPNFTGERVPELLNKVLIQKEWQERMLVRWGEDSPEYKSRVLGEFPDRNQFGFFPENKIEEARQRDLEPDGPPILGCDIGAGGDPNVFCLRRGPHVRIVESNYEPDTEKTGHHIAELIDKYNCIAIVDHVGVGNMAYSTAKVLRPERVFGCDFSSEARDPENYHNRKAELYTALRDRFIEDNIDIDERDNDLLDEMLIIEARTDTNSRVQIEHKDQIRRRLKRSTDRLDALVLTFGYVIPHGIPIMVGLREGPRFS